MLRYGLAALGAYLVFGLAVIEVREGRYGLGTGFAAAIVVATIKGLLMGWHSLQSDSHPTDLRSS